MAYSDSKSHLIYQWIGLNLCVYLHLCAFKINIVQMILFQNMNDTVCTLNENFKYRAKHLLEDIIKCTSHSRSPRKKKWSDESLPLIMSYLSNT